MVQNNSLTFRRFWASKTVVVQKNKNLTFRRFCVFKTIMVQRENLTFQRFWVREHPRHSQNTFAKKRYTFIRARCCVRVPSPFRPRRLILFRPGLTSFIFLNAFSKTSIFVLWLMRSTTILAVVVAWAAAACRNRQNRLLVL